MIMVEGTAAVSEPCWLANGGGSVNTVVHVWAAIALLLYVRVKSAG
jgi:hypothetical protein